MSWENCNLPNTSNSCRFSCTWCACRTAIQSQISQTQWTVLPCNVYPGGAGSQMLGGIVLYVSSGFGAPTVFIVHTTKTKNVPFEQPQNRVGIPSTLMCRNKNASLCSHPVKYWFTGLTMPRPMKRSINRRLVLFYQPVFSLQSFSLMSAVSHTMPTACVA